MTDWNEISASERARSVAPDGQTIDAEHGLVPHGGVNTLDQAEAVADYLA
jgi:hypothetical protein